MVAFNNMRVTFGQLLAGVPGAGFVQVKGDGWRATVRIGAVPAIALAELIFIGNGLSSYGFTPSLQRSNVKLRRCLQFLYWHPLCRLVVRDFLSLS